MGAEVKSRVRIFFRSLRSQIVRLKSRKIQAFLADFGLFYSLWCSVNSVILGAPRVS